MKGEHVVLALLLLWWTQRRNRALMKYEQIVALARQTGFPDPFLAAAVAMAESRVVRSNPPVADPFAHGDITLGHSLGLWQINLRAHPEFAAFALYDPEYNARAAFKVSAGGSNWKPWTTFREGTYRQYLPKPVSGEANA